MILGGIARRGRDWLLADAAPLWSLDDHFYPERMSILGVREACPQRLFVQARHVFSFIHAGRLGHERSLDGVAAVMDRLIAHARRPDGFYIHKFEPDGRVHDERADLYDQAFMLLAFAHASVALQRPDLMDAAIALDDALDANWRLPHGGYFEGEIALCPPYRQNPHMHLLEAFIALYDACKLPRWREKAEHLTDLARRRFIDPATGALLEYFDASLTPLPDRRVVEPGHCFEWAWLFEIAEPWLGPEALGLSDRLVGFARRHGLDQARGVAINEVSLNGAVIDGTARLWPQTERLKAALARFRRTRDPAEAEEAVAAFHGLSKYLDVPKRGAWRDKLRADGAWVEEPAPGSSLYHISCALMELHRTAELVD